MNNNKVLCTRCILESDFPHLYFNEDGICNYCVDWDKKWKSYNFKEAEDKLIKIFDKAKKLKRKYDCLIPYSGGRDSSYVLYLVKRKYGLNPLAVTFNNGFLSDFALSNILRTIKVLDVDHILYSYPWGQLKRMYQAMINAAGEFCSICSIGINHVRDLYQQKFKIPLIISGTSSRVDEASPFEINCSHPNYVRKVVSKVFSEGEINDFILKRQNELGLFELIKRKLLKKNYIGIDLPDYIEWDNNKIQEVLIEELDWKTPDSSKDHIDCKFASIKYYFKNQQIPGFIHKREKLSQLIRDGQISRKEAIGIMEKTISEDKIPGELIEFLTVLDLRNVDIKDIKDKSYLKIIKKEGLAHKKSYLYTALLFLWRRFKSFSIFK